MFAIPLHRILYLRLRCLDDMYYGVGLIDFSVLYINFLSPIVI